jgi:VWFA-related protein
MVAGATFAGGIPAAGQQAPQPFRSGRDLLTVNASVRDPDGHPVVDLGPGDFTVKVDGDARQVLTVRLFGADSGKGPDVTTPVPGLARAIDAQPGRVVVFAIDRDSMRSGSEKPALETAGRMLASLSPADAAGALSLPAGGIDLTRDRTLVAAAIAKMTGTAPNHGWHHAMSWDEARAYERGDRLTTNHVMERECPPEGGPCPGELVEQARDMLAAGRNHADTVLARLNDLLIRLGPLHGPKNLILISGGLPFDPELLARYNEFSARAAQAHVSVFAIHLDQASFDASDLGNFSVISGREYQTALGNLAADTGGTFFSATARATGVFNRIAAEINNFYELGVESRPSDADGKPHRIEVKVARPNMQIRAPARTMARAAGEKNPDALAHALAEPTDVAELPLEVATYMTHGLDPQKVKVVVAPGMPSGTGNAGPAREWGYTISDGTRVVTGRRVHVDSQSQPWSSTDNVEIAPGSYRLRVAAVDAGGSMGVLDMPLRVGLRAAGVAEASDLMIGPSSGGTLDPRGRVSQAQTGIALIELTSSETLAGTTGVLELTPAGAAAPIARLPFVLRTRRDDKRVVLAEAALEPRSLAPGTYTASAVLANGGGPFARISRIFQVDAGATLEATGEKTQTRVDESPATKPAAAVSRDPELDGVIERVGRYVSDYGEQASLIVGVEHYDQRYVGAPLGQAPSRSLVAEFALLKTTDATGWVGFRDVIEVDHKPVGDRKDRLQSLFSATSPDLAEARRIANESARFNIGPTRRNFNEPTSTLFFMLPLTQGRFVYTRKGETKIDGVNAWEIDFQEKANPTLIRTADGRDVACHGSIWVRPEDGAVLRTRLVLSGFLGQGSLSTIEVSYARDPRLEMWLPATMTERHEGFQRASARVGATPGVQLALVTGKATYTDFKRFEASASIK